MPKSLVLGNGNMLVCLDKYAQLRDLYFPYIGLENHIATHHIHRVGVFVDGTLRWLNDSSWKVTVNCLKDTFSSNIEAVNDELKIVLSFSDVIYNEKNIFLRKVKIHNKSDRERDIKIYFNQEFKIAESYSGDTVYFDPFDNLIVHYKGRRVFAVGGLNEDRSFNDYTTGIFEIEGREGSYVDANDGELSKNPIEHGRTDSIVEFKMSFKVGESKDLYYWVCVGKTIEEVRSLNKYIINKTPQHILDSTQDFWKAWINKYNFNFFGLNENIVLLFKKSLFNVRAHCDNDGSIIASSDSDMLQGGRDTYGYMWPRDASYSAMALGSAGDSNVVRNFFSFCNDIISKDGYFMHKYRPDKSLGSSWHPWVRNGKMELPIQEDETAIVIYALWKHYKITRDLEFIESVYNSLIEKAAIFMVQYRDEKTGLPKPSYDLWEEKFGISTYTASSVYGGLIAAANFADLLGKNANAIKYRNTAEEVKEGILKYLYDEDGGVFYKMINIENGEIIYDKTIDMSSVYGVYSFGVLDVDDERVQKAIKKTEDVLSCKTNIGGIARYSGDNFYRNSYDVPGNPWFVTTLWLAQYYIKKAKKESDLTKVKDWLDWATIHAIPSGILSEQLDPHTGEQISAAPLAWSHAEFIITVTKYLDKLEELGVCADCYPIRSKK